jgi:hypothetical protein
LKDSKEFPDHNYNFCPEIPIPHIYYSLQVSEMDDVEVRQTLETIMNSFMSVQNFKPKYSHFQTGKSDAFINGGIQIQVPGGEFMSEIPKDNEYLNIAISIKSSYELPINYLDVIDQEMTIESFLFKKAKQNNIYNYQQLAQVIDNESKVSSLEMFQRYTFTYEDPDYIGNLTNGLRPIQIQKLKPQSSIYRFFTQEIEISSHKLSFDECQQLIPKFEILKITNK